jgi:tetratricopeptide (TPR) repeat protein
MTRRLLTAAVVVLFATAAFASWYDDYDKGIDAVRAGDWAAVISRMTAAINAHPKENDRERTYGAIFINYHPYYYRGVAYLSTGKYQQAIDDFEKTSGPGEVDQGTVETLMSRAKGKLAPTPAPVPQPPVPVPPTPQPAGPTVDQALKRRASQAVSDVRQRMIEARSRNANSPAFATAARAFADLANRAGSAQTNDDFNRVITEAENVSALMDAVVAPSPVPQPVAPVPQPTAPRPVVPKPISATGSILAPYERDVRRALENYFAGDFEEASRQFSDLTSKLPDNAWLYAFLGASQYSQYAFEADEAYKNAAMESFRKAKALRSWKGGLPQKYFSRRIRRVFETAG